jgi:hypothetical protein
MSVFTIFCHGTASHRDSKDGEIIATFGRAMPRGDEYRTYLILDGPGGTGKSTPMAGTFNWASRDRKLKARFGNKEMGDGSRSGLVGGLVGGSGWDDNVRHAIVTIANLEPLPDTVNLVGWSRGAVTCLKIADALYDPSTTEGLFRQINVNIFAVDPVAGYNAGVVEDTRLITQNVKNYIGTLAQDERRGAFQPQDVNRLQIQNAGESNVVLLPFPGNHSTQVKVKKGLDEVPQIVFYLAYKFLSHFGTVFPDGASVIQHLTTTQLCNLYGKIKQKKSNYTGARNKGLFNRVQGGFKERAVKTEVKKYTKSARYFVNDHHRVCFKAAFPQVYEYFFTKHIPNPTRYVSKKILPSSPLGIQLQQMYQSSESSFDSLMEFGLDRSMSPALFTIPAPGAAHDPVEAVNSSGEATHLGSLKRMGMIV